MLQIISSGSVKAILVDREKLIENLKKISEDIKNNFEYVKSIILFGSLAQNTQRCTNDIDLIITVENFNKENFWEIYGELYNFIAEKVDTGFDLLVMDEEEFKRRKHRFGDILIL